MRIGIDIDNTLLDTNKEVAKKVLELIKKYLICLKLRPRHLTIKSAKNLHNNFLLLIKQIVPKEYAKEVINKLHEENNEIYLISSRNDFLFKNPYTFSEFWLDANKIYYDKLLVNIENKGLICQEYEIDILIDDRLKHCLSSHDKGIKAIKYDKKKKKRYFYDSVDNWEDIYELIQDYSKVLK